MSAIANDGGRFPAPLVEEVVDGVFESGGVAPVVLRGEEDEGGVALDEEGPGAGVGVGVLCVGGYLRGDAGFVGEGEVEGEEVDGVEGGGGGVGVTGPGGVAGGDVGGDLGADAGLAGGADYEGD